MPGGVPLHLLLVHAPIGLLLFGTLLILISFKRKGSCGLH